MMGDFTPLLLSPVSGRIGLSSIVLLMSAGFLCGVVCSAHGDAFSILGTSLFIGYVTLLKFPNIIRACHPIINGQ
jgi:hypothetical protein